MKKRNIIITPVATILTTAILLSSAFVTTFAGTTYAYSQCKQCGMLANVTITTTYPNANDTVHQVKKVTIVNCSKNPKHGETIEKTWSEKHTISNGICTGCGYRVH